MSSSFKRRGRKAPPARPSPSISPDVPSPPPPRRAAASAVLPGTRPWTGGLALTSTGVREVDALLFSSGGDGGGGQPLQTSTLLEEDRLSDDLARSLSRYWCAEGVAQGQMLLLGAFLPSVEGMLESLDGPDGAGCVDGEGCSPEELHDFVMSLPRNLHLDKAREKATKGASESNAGTNAGASREAISAIIEEEEGDDGDDGDDGEQSTADEGLVNAWQYRKSIQDARSGLRDGARAGGIEGDGIYCHSYDLSRRMWDQFSSDGVERETSGVSENPLVTRTKIVDCATALSASSAVTYGPSGASTAWHASLLLSVETCAISHLFPSQYCDSAVPTTAAGRTWSCGVVPARVENKEGEHPFGGTGNNSAVEVAVRTSSGRQRLNKMDTLATLRNAADSTFALDSFSSFRAPPPPEFSMLQGILTVRKCAPFAASHYTDSVTRKRPTAERFGIKRDGRKLTLQLLHLPPEEYSKGGSSTSGVRSGGGNVANSADTEQKIGGGHGGRRLHRRVIGLLSPSMLPRHRM
ncbi:hypothetical protein ACHAXT_013280 [Thalassiosira profunda]